jgi:hypothetical protein
LQLSDKDFQAIIIKIIKQAITNMPEGNENTESLIKRIEVSQRKTGELDGKLGTKNHKKNLKLKNAMEGSKAGNN